MGGFLNGEPRRQCLAKTSPFLPSFLLSLSRLPSLSPLPTPDSAPTPTPLWPPRNQHCLACVLVPSPPAVSEGNTRLFQKGGALPTSPPQHQPLGPSPVVTAGLGLEWLCCDLLVSHLPEDAAPSGPQEGRQVSLGLAQPGPLGLSPASLCPVSGQQHSGWNLQTPLLGC